jgi:hypothetical protein
LREDGQRRKEEEGCEKRQEIGTLHASGVRPLYFWLIFIPEIKGSDPNVQ